MLLSHHGCSARSGRTSDAHPLLSRGGERSAAPGFGPGSQTIREMAGGFSRFKPGCTVHINEGIVSLSELMGVTSEAPQRALKTRTLRTE